MKELLIFFLIFLVIFSFAVMIFNGRFIYAQIKYSTLGPPPIEDELLFLKKIAAEKRQEFFLPERLIIPLIGVDAPVVLSEGTDEYMLQKALEKGVVFWPGSNFLGEKGTIIMLGHSSAYPWYRGGYGSVFSLLNKLEINNEIFVFSGDKKYTYQVVGKEIKSPEEIILEQEKDDSILYLVSCWPVNTNWKRIVIKAVGLDKQ